jgi:hypothetical protein
MAQIFSCEDTQPLQKLRSDDHQYLDLLRLRQASAQRRELQRWLYRLREVQPHLGDKESAFNAGDVFIED